MKQLISVWGKQTDPGQVRQEYPRPNLVRNSYFNLNGMWDYCISRQRHTETYDGKILVPFSPESCLSGVQRMVTPEDYLHYRREFFWDEKSNRGRVLLHFGAVDQECEVSLNGAVIGWHKGGYLPFTFDITKHVVPGKNSLCLCVVDKTELAPHARGKQKLYKKGRMSSLFYTPNSGIWKTVWIESVPQDYIKSLRFTPYYDEKKIGVTIRTNRGSGEAELSVMLRGTTVYQGTIQTDREEKIPLGQMESWSPEHPVLYDVHIDYRQDSADSYFGMRKYEVRRDRKGILRFYLNNRPFFFQGVLDQGYWPESLLTAPSDEALRYDIEKLKELGFNTIRKHIKIESERFYYHCDKIGMAVWQDMPNGGGDYNMLFVTYLPNLFNWFARGVKDCGYRLFRREDAQGRKQYDRDLTGMVRLLYNYPCIAVWTPFNEGWGQFDAAKATGRIRALDKTRLVNEACGWFDQKGGDIYSIHNYMKKLRIKPQRDRVVALTEYGGYAYPAEGHLACEKEFGYRAYRSSEELTAGYERLCEKEIFPNIKRGLGAAVYTQTSDIEEEINGIMTYERALVKLGEEQVKRLNRKLYRIFDSLT